MNQFALNLGSPSIAPPTEARIVWIARQTRGIVTSWRSPQLPGVTVLYSADRDLQAKPYSIAGLAIFKRFAHLADAQRVAANPSLLRQSGTSAKTAGTSFFAQASYVKQDPPR